MAGTSNNLLYLQRQLRSAKGVIRRQQNQLEKLRTENAKLKLQAPMQDMLLVLIRLCRSSHEILQELLDKRTETHKVDHEVKGPWTNPP